MFLYVRFKQGEVTVGESVFFCCGRMILHRDYVQVVVTSAWTTHAPVHHEGINLAANVLSTDENCGVVIEEGHEMVDASPLWLLVTDKADKILLVAASHLYDALEGLLHLYVETSKSAADMAEETVHWTVIDMMIYLCGVSAGKHVEGNRGYPFPVAKVTEVEKAELLAAIETLVHLVQTSEGHAPFHVFL